MRFFRQYIDWIVGLLVAIEGIQFSISYFSEKIPETGSYIHENELFVLRLLSFISLALLLLVSAAYRRARRDRDQAESQYLKEIDLRDKTIELLKVDLASKREFELKFYHCNPFYLTLAMHNARCDWSLFHSLFLDGSDRRHSRQALLDARAATTTNLEQVLDLAAEVLSSHVGERCAACIQILDGTDESSLLERNISTIMRDSRSRQERATTQDDGVQEPHLVRNNSVHKRIFIDGVDAVVIDNIKQALESGGFYTTSKSAGVIYNSMFVVPIPNMPRSVTNASVIVDGPPRATLCIDNQSGRFRKDLHKYIAQELAWRLGVMLYRLTTLQRMLDAGGSRSRTEEAVEHGDPRE